MHVQRLNDARETVLRTLKKLNLAAGGKAPSPLPQTSGDSHRAAVVELLSEAAAGLADAAATTHERLALEKAGGASKALHALVSPLSRRTSASADGRLIGDEVDPLGLTEQDLDDLKEMLGLLDFQIHAANVFYHVARYVQESKSRLLPTDHIDRADGFRVEHEVGALRSQLASGLYADQLAILRDEWWRAISLDSRVADAFFGKFNVGFKALEINAPVRQAPVRQHPRRRPRTQTAPGPQHEQGPAIGDALEAVRETLDAIGIVERDAGNMVDPGRQPSSRPTSRPVTAPQDERIEALALHRAAVKAGLLSAWEHLTRASASGDDGPEARTAVTDALEELDALVSLSEEGMAAGQRVGLLTGDGARSLRIGTEQVLHLRRAADFLRFQVDVSLLADRLVAHVGRFNPSKPSKVQTSDPTGLRPDYVTDDGYPLGAAVQGLKSLLASSDEATAPQRAVVQRELERAVALDPRVRTCLDRIVAEPGAGPGAVQLLGPPKAFRERGGAKRAPTAPTPAGHPMLASEEGVLAGRRI